MENNMKRIELESRIAAEEYALEMVYSKHQDTGGYHEDIHEIEDNLMWYRGKLSDIDAEMWEDLLLIEDDYDPLPKQSHPLIHLSDEDIPF